jgi:signal transduction histidine kinase
MPKVVSMRHGRYVRPFDWPAAQKRFSTPLWPTMAAAYAAMNSATDAARERAESLSRDPNFTPTGRKSQMRAWLDAEGLAALKKGRAALAEAEREIEAARARMTGAAIDKSDVAGAMLRSEIRTWLRNMKPAERTARMTMGDLPREAVLAIIEAPAELSGVTVAQKDRLEATAVRALHPEEADLIATIEEAAEAVASAERAATLTVGETVGVGKGDVDEMLGGPSRMDRIRQLVGAPEPEEEDGDPDPADEAA